MDNVENSMMDVVQEDKILKKPLRRNRIPHRKRLKHVKRRKPSVSTKTEKVDLMLADVHAVIEGPNSAASEPDEVELEFVESPTTSLSDHDYSRHSSLSDHDYSRPSSSLSRPCSSMSSSLSISLPDLSEDSLMSDLSSGVFSPTLGFTPVSSPCPPTPQENPLRESVSPTLLPPPPPPPLPPPPCPPSRLTCGPSQQSGTPPSSPAPSPAAQQPHPPLSSPAPEPINQETQKLFLEVRKKLMFMLPDNFCPMVDCRGLHVLMVGLRESKAVQRSVFISPSGSVAIEVHGQKYPTHSLLRDVAKEKPLSEENLSYFTDRIVKIVSNLRLLEICAGMNKHEFKEVWSVTPCGVVESDTYKECRYTETFRSKQCTLLVETKNWRCKECTKLQPFLRRKLESSKQEEPHDNTNTRFLLDKQKNSRLAKKQKTIKRQSLTIDRLEARMQQLILQEGVKVEKGLSDDMTEILRSSNLTPFQSLFFQQQLKALSCKKSCGMRWHPTLIRLALSIYLKSPSAYEELSASGFIKLPSARTLFDYSHASRIEQGIDTTVLEAVAKQVEELDKTHKQYHVVMADEIHISKNLVVQKSTGEIIGFTNLNELDEEVKILDSYLEDPDKVVEPEIATKIMAFMVRGVSSKVKDVIASYPVCNPSCKQMYMWAWDVIGALERSGVRVIAFTCDGAPLNRAFIKLHKPATIVPSGVIFDTVNKYAPHRKLFFFSDVPHLLKTIRNALFNSRLNKKGTRLLKKNGEPMVWNTIIALYLSVKDKTLRKSYKLTAQSVFPDSYSRMKVKPAAVVFSNTVANDIRSKQWSNTSELVEFLSRTNNWFDLLNGASSSHGIRKNNRRLHPYTQKDIEEFQEQVPTSRFHELLDYLAYLEEWRQEIAMKQQLAANRSMMSELGVEMLDADGDTSFHALNDTHQEDEIEDSKCLLPHQTQLGIEMSTRAFIGAVTFLISEGVTFVNARVFCQDPLEQNFGKQRQGGGGSSNPNVSQYFYKQRNFSTIGQLAAVKRQAGNTEVVDGESEITSAPLLKRKCKRKGIS